MRRFAVMVGSHGRGSNMAALISAARSGYVPAEPALVIAPKREAPAVLRAQALGVPVKEIRRKSPTLADDLLAALEGIDVLCLAGCMFLIPEPVVHRYRDRILNVHPALLPKFGGKGMYGIRVHQAVIAAGEKESGCTIHYVNERYDEGDIVLQRRCPVLPEDTPETLADRVIDLEHEAYPEALKRTVSNLG